MSGPLYRVDNKYGFVASGVDSQGNPIKVAPGETKWLAICDYIAFLNSSQAVKYTGQAHLRAIGEAARRANCNQNVDWSVFKTPAGPGEIAEPEGGEAAGSIGAPRIVLTAEEWAAIAETEPVTLSTEEIPQPPVLVLNRPKEPFGVAGENRDPADVALDPEQPAAEAQIREAYEALGLPPEQAADAAGRAARGDPQPGEPRATHAGEQAAAPAQGGDPVELFSGLFVLRAVDIEVPTPFLPIRFERVYLSGRPYYGPFGYNWDHNWNVYLRELASGNVAHWDGALREEEFVWDGARFEPPRGVFARLERQPFPDVVYTLQRPEGVTLTFRQPPNWTDAERIPLVRVADRFGNALAFEYDEHNRIRRIRDDDGRGLDFHYGECGLLEVVQDHTGRRVRYWHAPDVEHLVTVELPPTPGYPDGVRVRYEYDSAPPHPAHRHNIVRVSDHDGNVVVQTEYGSDPASFEFNRVVLQYQGGYGYRFAYEPVQAVPPNPVHINVVAQRTVVMQPDGALYFYSFNYRGDLLDERVRLVRDGSHRVAARQWEYDAQGNVSTAVHPDGSRTEYTWNHDHADPRMRGNLLQVELRAAFGMPSPSRIVMRADYDPVFQLRRTLVDENGAATRYVYDFDETPGPAVRGALLRIELPQVTLPDGAAQSSVVGFEVGSRGLVEAITGPEGERTELNHFPGGSPRAGFLRELRRDAGGEPLTTAYDYDARGYLKSQTSNVGVIERYRKDADGRLIELILADAGAGEDKYRFRYNARSGLRSIESPRGQYSDSVIEGPWIHTALETDPLDHVRAIALGENTARPRRFRAEPDFRGKPVWTADPLGVESNRCYDERGLLLEQIEAAGSPEARTARYYYDIAGRLKETHEPGSRVTRYDYDTWGRLAKVLLPGGTELRQEWGPMDMVLRREIAGSPGDGAPPRVLSRADFAYDERGRPVRVTAYAFEDEVAQAIALVAEHWFDREDRPVRTAGLHGAVWTRAFDGHGRLVEAVDPVGNTTVIDYGPDGRPKRATTTNVGPDGPLTLWVEFSHDARGRLVKMNTSYGAEMTRAYDARDQVVVEIHASGVQTEREYGLLGELTRETVDPDDLALAYDIGHDDLGRPVWFRDPTGEKTHIDRDPLGRPLRLRLADGSEYGRTYDAAGRIARAWSPDGSATRRRYDAQGNLTRLLVEAGPGREPVPAHRFRYDGLGRLVRAQSAGLIVRWRHDSLGRIVRESLLGRVFERSYDYDAGEIELRYPGGRIERHAWDALGRIRRVRLIDPGVSEVAPASGAPGTTLAEFGFLGQGALAEIFLGNGAETRLRYDEALRPVRIEHRAPGGALVEAVSYRYDRAGRRRVATLEGPPAETHLYIYDARGRLRQHRAGFPLVLLDAESQGAQEADIAAADAASAAATSIRNYALDGADVRKILEVTEANVAKTVAYTVAAGHRTVAVNGSSIGYDADGRRLSDGARKVRYDGLGRPVRVEDAASGAPLVLLSYDPLGRWLGAESGGVTVRRFHMGRACLQAEDASGHVLWLRSYAPPQLAPLLETQKQGTRYLHVDGHQSLVVATDGLGSPVARYRFDPFGVPRAHDGAGTALPLGAEPEIAAWFAGMPALPATDFYWTPARLYDPATGLFLARDPRFLADSPSPYVFAAHDPVNQLDPEGEAIPVIVWVIVAGGALGGGAGYFGFEDPDEWTVGGGIVVGALSAGIAFYVYGVVAAWTGASLLGGGVATGTAAATTGATTGGGSTLVSLTSGMVGGIASGGTGAFVSGSGWSVIHQGREYGSIDPELALWAGAQEIPSGMAGGAVTGPFHQWLLRVNALPPGTLGAMRSAGGPAPWGTLGRAAVSPYGLGGPFLGGTSSYVTGFVRRQQLMGLSAEEAAEDALGDVPLGMAYGAVSTALNPTTHQNWLIRINPRFTVAPGVRRNYADIVFTRRVMERVHHDRSFAAYPELTPVKPYERPGWGLPSFPRLVMSLNNGLTQGNLRPFTSQAQHRQFHNQWRFGQGGSWSRIRTHGPFTPGWLVVPIVPDPRNTNYVAES